MEHSSQDWLAQQASLRLAALRAAGIDWVPRVRDPLPLPTAPVDQQPSGTDDMPRAQGQPVKNQDRRLELEQLAATVSKCARCEELFATRTQTVFGVGPLDAELCFVGEAPGADEDRTGEPFVGAAGQLLNKIIVACGMQREEVYICNTIKCRPPNNRNPSPTERANCRDYFDTQLGLVRPKYICCLGAVAAQNLLNTTTSIGKLRGKFHDYQGIPVLCTFHPAYLLRNPAAKKDCWEDMQLLMRTMGRTIPPTSKT